MKKSFYFALALTTGLFASCSSDDLSQAPQQGLEINDTDLAQISINVGTPNGKTRGTGSVSGEEWAGQEFNLFMFKKWTFQPAQYVPEEGADPVDIYNNATLITGTDPTDLTLAVQQDENGVRQFQYFPSTGQFAFWAYRADDAALIEGEGDEAHPVVKLTNNAGEEVAENVATQVRIPVVIDGSQDLMIAATDTTDAAKRLNTADNKIDDDDVAAEKIYSAYASRRGVNPRMQFSHLLTRLTFEIKAAEGCRDVSTAATKKTSDDNEILGFSVTKVEVLSKSKGDMIVAHKGAAAGPEERMVWDEGQTWVSGTEWPAIDETTGLSPTGLAPFELRSRVKTLDEKAQIGFVQRAKDVTSLTVPETHTFVVADGAKEVANSGNKNVGDNTEVYDSDEIDPVTGEPAGNKITIGAIKGDNTKEYYYYLFVRAGNHEGTDTPYSEASYVDDPSEPLTDELIAVTPKWEGYEPATEGTPTWQVLEEAVTGYEWTKIANPTNEQKEAGDNNMVDEIPVTGTAGENGTGTVGDNGEIVGYDNFGRTDYYICAQKKNTDNYKPAEAVPAPNATTRADIGKVIKVVDTYYRCNDVDGTEAEEGHPVATPIGESLLVAPADDKGYLIRFTFERSKKITGDHTEKISGDAVINVKVKNDGSFVAGKTYKVTAILYSDGEIKTEGATIIKWVDGTSELDDGGEGYGLE